MHGDTISRWGLLMQKQTDFQLQWLVLSRDSALMTLYIPVRSATAEQFHWGSLHTATMQKGQNEQMQVVELSHPIVCIHPVYPFTIFLKLFEVYFGACWRAIVELVLGCGLRKGIETPEDQRTNLMLVIFQMLLWDVILWICCRFHLCVPEQ